MPVFQLIRPRIYTTVPGHPLVEQREDPFEMNQPCKLSSRVISRTLVLGALGYLLWPQAFTRKITLSARFHGRRDGQRDRQRERERERYVPVEQYSWILQVDRSSSYDSTCREREREEEARVKRSREPAGSHKLWRFKRLGPALQRDEETIFQADHHGYALSALGRSASNNVSLKGEAKCQPAGRPILTAFRREDIENEIAKISFQLPRERMRWGGEREGLLYWSWIRDGYGDR